MPRFILTSDDFKSFDITLDGDHRTFWRDGNWHLTDGDGDIRLGSRNLHWGGGAILRAVEQMEPHRK